jgi:hypothetical protein
MNPSPLPPAGSVQFGALPPAEIEIFPEAWEIMGQWFDPTMQRVKYWVRFFCTDSQGRQVGPDLFNRFFESGDFDFLLFMCARRLRSALALEPQKDLTREEREGVAEILRARGAPRTPASFLEVCKRALVTIRRKAGGLNRRAVVPMGLAEVARRDGLLLLKGN